MDAIIDYIVSKFEDNDGIPDLRKRVRGLKRKFMGECLESIIAAEKVSVEAMIP